MELWKKLQTTEKPIVLYGMGNGAERILDVLDSYGIRVSGIFASDDFVRYQSFRGFTVERYADLKERYGAMVVLVAFGTHRPEVMANIKRIMEEQEVYVPDVPVAGETLFNEAFVEAHRGEFQAVYELLADDRSKEVYRNILRAKLTGELEPLFESECDPEEAWSLLQLGEDEVYLDLGAYNGDTVRRFLEKNPNYREIIALEPDVKNYKKLVASTEELERILCLNACADEAAGERFYEMDGGRKSHALQKGGVSVPSVTVDGISAERTVSFIKMDVEGMEAAVIRGAKQTVSEQAPAMQIAAYHRSEDLFSLPLEIHRLRPDAEIFIRHFPAVPAWDTDFYIRFSKKEW